MSAPFPEDDDALLEMLGEARRRDPEGFAAAAGLREPCEPEPADELDDAGPFVNEVSGAALRGLAAAALLVVALVFVALLFLADSPSQKVAAGILAVGCAFALHRIGRGGPR